MSPTTSTIPTTQTLEDVRAAVRQIHQRRGPLELRDDVILTPQHACLLTDINDAARTEPIYAVLRHDLRERGVSTISTTPPAEGQPNDIIIHAPKRPTPNLDYEPAPGSILGEVILSGGSHPNYLTAFAYAWLNTLDALARRPIANPHTLPQRVIDYLQS